MESDKYIWVEGDLELDSQETSGLYNLKARCSSCSRFLKIKASASSDVVVTCTDRRCRAENNIKVVMLTDYERLRHGHNHEPKKAKPKDSAIV